MKVRVLRGRLWIALLAAVVTAVTTLGQTTINLNPGDDIQAAIGAASGGDTIVLAPGVYDVPKTIVVNKSLMISSAGATLQGTTPSALCVLEVAASNVTISGLGITWATLLESTVAGAELTDSLVRIPANLYLSGVVIVGNTIYLPAQSGAMSTWVARALTIGRNGCTDVTIASNTVYNTRNGIVLQYNNTATLTGNVIYATKGGIMNYTNTLADAANRTMSDNSWGTAHNEWDIVWNSANYDPDYQESVIALSASNGGAYVVDRRDSAGGHAVGNRSHIFVNLAGTTAVSEVNGNPNLPYATIGLAITGVADDGTIYVAEGTWQEQVVLSTDKSLIGSGSGTVIESPVTLTQFFSTGATKNYPIIYIHDAESASVRDLIVDGLGRGNSNYRFIGIGFYNAGGTVDGVEIRSIRNTPFSGAQHGVGLYAYNVDGTPRGLVISSSTIRDFQKNAMAIMGTGLTVTVTGNVIVGAGPTTVTAQNGVQLSSGAAGTIQDNSISGIWYTGAGWAASSILIYDAADGVAVVGNTITGGQVGVYGYLTDDLVIERNVIENGDYSLLLCDPGATVHFNSMSANATGLYAIYPTDATLNWWGAPDGPWADEDIDGSADHAGGGDPAWGPVIFSPWLGTNPDGDASTPGVQVTAPILIVVAPVGPEPTGGYLNAAIVGSNSAELPCADTIYLYHGAYDGSEPIAQPVTIASEPGSASHTTVTGAMNIGSGGVTVGLPLQGLRIDGDITVATLVDAATVHINWCDLYGTATNDGDNTLDAQYNFWGTQEEAVIDARTIGDIDYAPYLPKNADDSYTDIVSLLTAGVAGSLDGAVDQLWTMSRMGMSAQAYAEYQGLAGAGGLHSAPTHGQVVATLLPGGGGGAVTPTGIAGGYVVGDKIVGQIQVTDPLTGLPVSDAIVTISLLNAESGVVYWGVATYDESLGEYVFEVDTGSLAPGEYDLIIQTDDGETETLTVVVAAA